jgi:hypothetical protein
MLEIIQYLIDLFLHRRAPEEIIANYGTWTYAILLR